MLLAYTGYGDVFVEITTSTHDHGGAGWEFGTCLWSPSRNKAGADRYALMRAPKRGNLVLHIYHDTWPNGVIERRVSGYSVVSEPCKKVQEEPPSAGDWAGMAPYYRVELENYTSFPAPLSIDTFLEYYGSDVRRDLSENRPKYYPFNTYGNTVRTVQGIYLARCTPQLYSLVLKALHIEEATQQFVVNRNLAPHIIDHENIPHDAPNLHSEYSEGRRQTAERYFFARNPKLTKDAKAYYGSVCQGCEFDYGVVYGELGAGYIEVHHLNPLSERTESEWIEGIQTSIAEVTVLCANCHRMIHRKRPALSLEELKQHIVKHNFVDMG
jgi:hypothetical protein